MTRRPSGTGTTRRPRRLSGYSPNPSTFNTWLFQAEGIATYQKLFSGDSVIAGGCTPEAQMQMQPPAEQRASSQDTNGLFPPVFPDVLLPPLNP